MTPSANQATHDSVAIVTGGARGIGKGIVSRLRAENWSVDVWDLTGDAGSRSVDVRDRVRVHEATDQVIDDYGHIDLLVNNAGVTNHRPLASISWEDWSHVIDVDLHGVFNCLQAVGAHMLERGNGSIVNIASVSAERGAPGRAAYCTAKAAVVGLTRSAAVEWATRGVRVNAVGPGYVETGVYRQGVAEGRLDPSEILRRTPMNRLAQPNEIATVVSFLASTQAAYVTGQTFYVDGGFLADFGVGSRLGDTGADDPSGLASAPSR